MLLNRRLLMKRSKTNSRPSNNGSLLQPSMHQHGQQIQDFHSVIKDVPLGVSARTRQTVVNQLNQILADTMTLRDLYKKSRWQVSGAACYQLHLPLDKHYTR